MSPTWARPERAFVSALPPCAPRWKAELRRSVARAVWIGAVGALVAALGASPASAIRIAVKGDWGDGSKSQVAVTKRMCVEYDRAPFAFTLTTGDNFYPTGKATRQSFQIAEKCLIDRRVPYRAAWGNHDIGGGNSTATVLRATRRWYSFVSGPVRFVVLDANQPSSRDQLKFLEQTLIAETARPVIVAYHQGTRTAGLHPPQTTQQERWEPLFVKHGVRLVLQGHNHLYERIRYKDVTYVTTGGGGYTALYPCSRKTDGLVKCIPIHHFLMVEATPSKIGVRAIKANGEVIDRFRIGLTPPSA